MCSGLCALVPVRVEETDGTDILCLMGLIGLKLGDVKIQLEIIREAETTERRAKRAGTLRTRGRRNCSNCTSGLGLLRYNTVQKQQRPQHVVVRARALSIPIAGDINKAVGNAEITSWE
jgi:predicted ABC-class ATPase